MNDATEQPPSRLWRKAGLVWLALNIALAATVAGAYLDIGIWKLPLSMSIATLKAAIVVIIFMGLVKAGASARIATLAGALWLALLIGLSLADEATRLHLPPGYATAPAQ